MAKDERSMSEDSISYLEEVKKGKPRKFAMITKGSEVVSLVVYKKGNVEKFRKEAKQSGRGQFCFGIVDGKGIDIRFVLARSDGFEAEPVKSTKLKAFLEEAADLKCKPHFEIVDALPFALDELDPLVQRFRALQPSAIDACNAHPDRADEINTLCLRIGGHLDQDQTEEATIKLTELETLLGSLRSGSSSISPTPSGPASSTTGSTPQPVSTPSPDSSSTTEPTGLEANLIEALKRLKPTMANAVEIAPDRKGEITAAVTNIRELLKSKQFPQAQADIVALGKLLKSLIANASPGTKPAAPTVAGDLGSDPAARFAEQLKQLIPRIKSLTGTPVGDQCKLLVSEAGVFARKQDFASALALLAQAQGLLGPASPPSMEGPTNLNDQFEALKQRLEPKFQLAQQMRPDKSEVLQKAWNFARDQALDGKLPSAVTTLEKLESSIDKMLAESTVPKAAVEDVPARSNVALQKSLLAWESACKQMTSRLEEFEQFIMNLFKDDARLVIVKQNIHKLDAVLGDFAEELRDRLDEAYNAPDQFKPAACKDAMEVLGRYRSYLDSDPFVKAVDGNTLLPVEVENILGKALATVAANLSA